MQRFALDAIRDAKVLDGAAIETPLTDVGAVKDAGYGAHAGGQCQSAWRAVLTFSLTKARWIRHERWQPGQTGILLPNGRYRNHTPEHLHRRHHSTTVYSVGTRIPPPATPVESATIRKLNRATNRPQGRHECVAMTRVWHRSVTTRSSSNRECHQIGRTE